MTANDDWREYAGLTFNDFLVNIHTHRWYTNIYVCKYMYICHINMPHNYLLNTNSNIKLVIALTFKWFAFLLAEFFLLN